MTITRVAGITYHDRAFWVNYAVLPPSGIQAVRSISFRSADQAEEYRAQLIRNKEIHAVKTI